jgi:hypothetical protein
VRPEHLVYQIQGFLLVLSLAAWGLWLLIGHLRRGRPDLALGLAITAAVGIRLAAAAGISLLPNSRALRGTDELVFLYDSTTEVVNLNSGAAPSAEQLRALPLADMFSLDVITPLHTWLIALQQRLFDASDMTLRLTLIVLAVAGIALLATAVYDLAGPTAAQLAAWLMAFEPTSVFFSGYLHKDPLITFAVGLVTYGFVRMWRQRSLRALAIICAGCVVATLTRPYVGWVLAAAAVTLTLHAAMRSQQRRRAALLAGTAVCFSVVAVYVALQEAPAQLERLQQSQEANVNDSSNLKYEAVDYSTPTAVAASLPIRVSDFLLRPYPWQLQNLNQQLGAVGGVVVLIALFSVATSFARSRGVIMARAGPLLYVGGALILAYSVTAGNAGTAFRLRENVTAVLICTACALRPRREEQPAMLARGRLRLAARGGKRPSAAAPG